MLEDWLGVYDAEGVLLGVRDNDADIDAVCDDVCDCVGLCVCDGELLGDSVTLGVPLELGVIDILAEPVELGDID